MYGGKIREPHGESWTLDQKQELMIGDMAYTIFFIRAGGKFHDRNGNDPNLEIHSHGSFSVL